MSEEYEQDRAFWRKQSGDKDEIQKLSELSEAIKNYKKPEQSDFQRVEKGMSPGEVVVFASGKLLYE